MKSSNILLRFFSQFTLINELWLRVQYKRRRQFFLLIVLMIAASFAEIFSLGAVIPFLTILSTRSLPSGFEEFWFRNLLYGFSSDAYILLVTTIFISAIAFAGALRLILLWASTKFSYAIGADISIEVYSRTLYQKYLVHAQRNSSEIISAISLKTKNVIHVVMMLMNLISAAFLLIFLILALLMYSPTYTFIIFIAFGVIYGLVISFFRKKLLENSYVIGQSSDKLIKSLQEGLGGIRDILLNGSQPVFINDYRHTDTLLRRASANNAFLTSSPRYLVETLAIVLIVLIAYFIVVKFPGDNQLLIGLAVVIICAQRFLPVLQQAYTAITSIIGLKSSMEDILGLLNQKMPTQDRRNLPKLIFEKEIELKNVYFRYLENSEWAISDFNFVIKKGDRVGIIGKTGCGKSTLVDLLMGLLPAEAGQLVIDGVVVSDENTIKWQSNIAHVPQFIYLTDRTVQENIAFGVPSDEIDMARVRAAARQAQLLDLIESWPKKFETVIGENGLLLSGGQRQRIGIARALYKDASVLVLDEATSSLDNQTESDVMNVVNNLDIQMTVIMIAHRLTTLKSCDYIIELENGRINNVKSYENMLKTY